MEVRNSSPVVLLTGSSSGIGLALAKLVIASRRFRLVATARPRSIKILAANGIQPSDTVLIRPLDVSLVDTGLHVIHEVNRLWGGVDILINNAGISFRSTIEDMREDEEQLQMATNYLGPVSLIRAVLPSMRAKRFGRIINVSSVSGMMAMPTMGSYAASKFALEGASEALWYELRPWNIAVSLVQPGFVNSDSHTRVYCSKHSKNSIPYAAYYECMEEFVSKLMRRALATPQSVARKIFKTIESRTPPLRVAATADAHFFSLLRRLLPRGAYHRLLYSQLPHVDRWLPVQRNAVEIHETRLKYTGT